MYEMILSDTGLYSGVCCGHSAVTVELTALTARTRRRISAPVTAVSLTSLSASLDSVSPPVINVIEPKTVWTGQTSMTNAVSG